MITPLVVGNWKMNGTQSEAVRLARQIVRHLKKKPTRAEVVVAPPFTALSSVGRALRQSKVKLAAQNSHWATSGAFTGEISPPMLNEIGCDYVIVGHSERRHVFHESDEMVARKIEPIIAHGMRAVLCIGETLDERRQEKTSAVLTSQLDSALKGLPKGVIEKIEIAYEPVWAIGTGQNATPDQVSQVHEEIRHYLRQLFGEEKGGALRILYGGSVKPDNALTLVKVEEVNGLLVGGASLTGASFLPIVEAFSEK